MIIFYYFLKKSILKKINFKMITVKFHETVTSGKDDNNYTYDKFDDIPNKSLIKNIEFINFINEDILIENIEDIDIDDFAIKDCKNLTIKFSNINRILDLFINNCKNIKKALAFSP